MATESTQPAAIVWGRDARAWASLLIFAHLFAVTVAVTSYSRQSGLQARLHELFATYYLRPLHLTPLPVTYPFARFYLTHALTNSDVDFRVDVELEKDGKTTGDMLPPPD